MPATRPFKSLRRTGHQQAATPAFHQGHQGHQSRQGYQQGYQGEMDGASQTPLRTPSSNNSAFTHHPQLHRACYGRFSPADDFTPSIPPRGIPHSATASQLPLPPPLGFTRANKSSATWTSSSGDLAGLSDSDEIQDRPEFVYEYNRLARKHGIRALSLGEHRDRHDRPVSAPPPAAGHAPELTLTSQKGGHSPRDHRRGWFSTFLRQISAASSASSPKQCKRVKHKRSVGELAKNLVQFPKRDSLRDEDLQSLVRLCGKSMLYLPAEYAPSSLVLPTCFRATAQYLVQHAADTRGVFRIPGSIRVVNALYGYYCAEGDVGEIAGTTRCPNLPLHIKAGTHDVASAFKRLLAGLPGGILGSLPLFDALVAIHSQLKGDAEHPRTKQTKLRARLIALAVRTVRSQFRRELICAVFGLLCLVGRAAERTPREDEHGRPLPTADLMGYNALGIVFGPLLVGDLINVYTMRLADPRAGLVLFPVTPPHMKTEKRKNKVSDEEDPRMLSVDKIHVANAITEMMITHWRDVVKHMKDLRVLRLSPGEPVAGEEQRTQNPGLRPSASESFIMRKPAEWICRQPPAASTPPDMSRSPAPPSPTLDTRRSSGRGVKAESSHPSLIVRRARPKGTRSLSSSRKGAKLPLQFLSPTVEEPPFAEFEQVPNVSPPVARSAAPMAELHLSTSAPLREPIDPSAEPASMDTADTSPIHGSGPSIVGIKQDETSKVADVHTPIHQDTGVTSGDTTRLTDETETSRPVGKLSGDMSAESPFRIPLPEATASPRVVFIDKRPQRASAESMVSRPIDGGFRATISRLRRSQDQTRDSTSAAEHSPVTPTPTRRRYGMCSTSPLGGTRTRPTMEESPTLSLGGARRARLPTIKPKNSHKTYGDSPILAQEIRQSRTSRHLSERPGSSDHLESVPPRDMVQLQVGSVPARQLRCNAGSRALRVQRLSRAERSSTGHDRSAGSPDVDSPVRLADIGAQPDPDDGYSLETAIREPTQNQSDLGRWPLKYAGRPAEEEDSVPITPSHAYDHDSSVNITPVAELGFMPRPPSRHPLGVSTGSAVKAMAAKFEGATKDSIHITSLAHDLFGPSGVVSKYTVNPSPIKVQSPRKPEVAFGPDAPSPSQRLPAKLLGEGSGAAPARALNRHFDTPKVDVEEVEASVNAQNDEYRGMRRDVVPPDSEDPASPGLKKRREKPGGMPAPSDMGSETPAIKPAMKALSHQRGHTPKPAEGVDLEKSVHIREVRSPNAAEPSSLLLSSSMGLDSEKISTATSQMLPPVMESSEASTASPGANTGNMALHVQIHSLEKQLSTKTEEVQQLRQRLAAKRDPEVMMSREQLRRAERERAMWRERAEAAERRVERLARMKRLGERETDSDAGGGDKPVLAAEEPITGDGTRETDSDGARGSWVVNHWLDRQQQESAAEHTGDEAVVAERIRESLRARAMDSDGGGDVDVGGTTIYRNINEGSTAGHAETQWDATAATEATTSTIDAYRTPPPPAPPQIAFQLPSRDGTTTSSDEEERLSAAVASLWMAAEDRLELGLEREQGQSETPEGREDAVGRQIGHSIAGRIDWRV